jgi:hypothetical protein
LKQKREKNVAARLRYIPNNPQGTCALGGLFATRIRRAEFYEFVTEIAISQVERKQSVYPV